jgi:phage baseplate assembly protein W
MTSYTKDLSLLGTDIALQYMTSAGTFEDADLMLVATRGRDGRRSTRDVGTVADVDAAVQFLADRLKTRKGELAALGHPEYGSRHHELIGEPNIDRTRSLIKLYVLEALRHEPRIEKVVGCEVFAPHQPPRSEVRIVVDAVIVAGSTPVNLVVPFNLEVAP